MQQLDIPLGKLFVSKLNVRKDLKAGQEDSGIAELASSIKQQGLLTPLTVRAGSDGRYEVVLGQRRLLACQRIGHDPVACLVRNDLDDDDAVTISLVENVHRANMHPLDKARALKALYDRHRSYKRLADESAWTVDTIKKYLRLLDLPEELQRRLSTGSGSAGIGTMSKLAGTFSGDDAVKVLDKISGFTQKIQEGIIKLSKGDIAQIDHLVRDAREGAFDIRHCGGAFKCEIIRDILERRISQAGFQEIVRDVAENLESEVSRTKIREATRAFWKVLAND